MPEVPYLKHTDIDRVILEPKAGADITSCLSEAVIVAFSMRVYVEIVNNGKTYSVSHSDFLRQVFSTESTD